MRHTGYLRGVTGQPPQSPPCCRHDEYRYYYDQGRHVISGHAYPQVTEAE